jgi:hypothetical protein
MIKGIILGSLVLMTYIVSSFTWTKTRDVSEKTFKTEYIYVLIIDGPRFTETFGDTSYQYIPYLGKELLKQGVLMYNFRNNGSTYTNSGHAAITTGVYQRLSNGGKELPHYPSMFQYYLKSKNAKKNDAYIVASKGKLQILANTSNKKWWNMYNPASYCGPNGLGADYASDQETFNKVNELVSSNNPPHLMLVNFLAVDSYGHSNQWDMYLKSLIQCDNYVYQIWNTIQSNPVLKDKTTLFITNDHGRHLDGHKDGFVNHGDKCEGCRHISLLAIGPDFKQNEISKNCSEQLDISKTISVMMGFDMPTSKGRVLSELFK